MNILSLRNLLVSLSSALCLASCGGGGGGGDDGSSNSGVPSTLITSASRDANGDVLVGETDFVMEAESGDWLYKAKGYPSNYNFHLYIPPSYKTGAQNYPLLIHLHGDDGYTETRTNLTMNPLFGSPLGALYGASAPNAAGLALLNAHVGESIVIAPELPHIDRTGNFAEPLGYWNPNAIKKIIAFLKAKYRIDASRIYVTGLSLGGGGTWHVTNRSADLVAAAVPICGGYSLQIDAATRAVVPFWVFQSYDDPVVPFQNSLAIFNMLTAPALAWSSFPTGSKAPTSTYTVSYAPGTGLTAWMDGERTISGMDHYTLYPTGGHNAWDRAYANSVMWDWLYAQSKPK